MPQLFSYRDSDLYSHHSLDPAPRPEEYTMHAHELMEIYYFISGEGSYSVEGTPYPLCPGDILIMRAAETHTLTIRADVPYERIAIHFSPKLLAGIDPELRLLRPFLDRPLGQRNRYSAQEDPQGRLRAAFADFCFAEIPQVRTNLLARLLLFLTTLDGLQRSVSGSHLPQSVPGQLVSYVNDHLFEDLSLQALADRFYRSRSQTARLFRQATGSPLGEYVKLKRLMAARAMLQRGESASAACIACGFSDYSAFFRAYRAHFGHAPRDDSGKGST